jgi:hypothetical protein
MYLFPCRCWQGRSFPNSAYQYVLLWSLTNLRCCVELRKGCAVSCKSSGTVRAALYASNTECCQRVCIPAVHSVPRRFLVCTSKKSDFFYSICTITRLVTLYLYNAFRTLWPITNLRRIREALFIAETAGCIFLWDCSAVLYYIVRTSSIGSAIASVGLSTIS